MKKDITQLNNSILKDISIIDDMITNVKDNAKIDYIVGLKLHKRKLLIYQEIIEFYQFEDIEAIMYEQKELQEYQSGLQDEVDSVLNSMWYKTESTQKYCDEFARLDGDEKWAEIMKEKNMIDIDIQENQYRIIFITNYR
jgi:hypothetical protein